MIGYVIDTGYACFRIEVDNSGICREAAPIAKWMIGKHISYIKKWKRIIHISCIGEPNESSD